MKTAFNDIAMAKSSGEKIARPELGRANEFCNLGSLCGLAIVTFEETAEFAFATNYAFGLRSEVCVENGVVPADTSVRSFEGCKNVDGGYRV